MLLSIQNAAKHIKPQDNFGEGLLRQRAAVCSYLADIMPARLRAIPFKGGKCGSSPQLKLGSIRRAYLMKTTFNLPNTALRVFKRLNKRTLNQDLQAFCDQTFLCPVKIEVIWDHLPCMMEMNKKSAEECCFLLYYMDLTERLNKVIDIHTLYDSIDNDPKQTYRRQYLSSQYMTIWHKSEISEDDFLVNPVAFKDNDWVVFQNREMYYTNTKNLLQMVPASAVLDYMLDCDIVNDITSNYYNMLECFIECICD